MVPHRWALLPSLVTFPPLTPILSLRSPLPVQHSILLCTASRYNQQLFFLVGSIPAVICGHIGLKQVRETQESGRSLAIAGLVLGYIPIAAIILVLAIGAITSTAISIFGLTIQL